MVSYLNGFQQVFIEPLLADGSSLPDQVTSLLKEYPAVSMEQTIAAIFTSKRFSCKWKFGPSAACQSLKAELIACLAHNEQFIKHCKHCLLNKHRE